jgi:pimeloyl-ACP methyl ester carboxylesterase
VVKRSSVCVPWLWSRTLRQ